MSLRSALVAMIEEIDRILDESKKGTKPCAHKVSYSGCILFDNEKQALKYYARSKTWWVDANDHIENHSDKFELTPVAFDQMKLGEVYESENKLILIISYLEYACLVGGREVRVNPISGNLNQTDTYYKLTAKEL